MTVIAAPVALSSAPSALPPVASRPSNGRDTGIDLLRALCVVGVVVLHALMVGVAVSDGTPVFDNASTGTWWIVPVSWLLQVMPLFFVIGGFSGFLAYTASRRRGDTAASFVTARVHRLLGPALVVIGAVGALLALLLVTGVPAELVAVAGYRYGQPLWFLGVFLLCQALLPAMVAAHRRRPVVAMLSLVAASVAVDAVRLTTGVPALGFLNLAFVWLALQQLGFFLADGSIDALGRRTRGAAAIVAVGLLLLTVVTGIHSPDLIANINPPTTALLLVGAAHTALVSVNRSRLTRASRHPVATAFSAFVNRRTMTIYLWHMPVLLAMAGVTALTALVGGAVLAPVGSAAWMAERPLWLLAALALTALLAVPLARIENRPAPAAVPSRSRAAAAVTAGLTAVVLLLVCGTTPATAAIAVALLAGALRLARAPGRVGAAHAGDESRASSAA